MVVGRPKIEMAARVVGEPFDGQRCYFLAIHKWIMPVRAALDFSTSLLQPRRVRIKGFVLLGCVVNIDNHGTPIKEDAAGIYSETIE